MRKIQKFLRKFRQGNSLRASLKVLKVLAKNHSMFLWRPVEKGVKKFGDYKNCSLNQDYCVTLKSTTTEYCTIIIGATKGEFWENYDFGIKCGSTEVWIRYNIDFDLDQITVQQLLTWRKLSLSTGYLINELYNKVANQLQFIIELNKLKEALETKELRMT